ncbi:hypothetical protein J2W42_006724 [Rhizobium tibeticum]|nr:hypothetical protein [Rhizobium tibeticum]
MPSFLVSTTTVVDAPDENTAAEIAFVKIATLPNLAFEVRSDEERVTRIELTLQRRQELTGSP